MRERGQWLKCDTGLRMVKKKKTKLERPEHDKKLMEGGERAREWERA